MQNAAEAGWPPVFLDHVQAIGPGITAMNDNRQLGLLCKRHLIAKHFLLHIARRMIVVVVKTDLAPGNNFGMLRQPRQFLQMLWRDFLRFVRMYTDGGVNPIMLFGKRQRGIQLLGSRRAIEHSFAVFRELRKLNVRV